MAKKIIITGTGGMVGQYVDQCQWHLDVVKTRSSDFDVANLQQVESFFRVHGPDTAVIVHLAAETDVDKCEKDFDHAFRVNVIGAQNMAYQALRYDVPMLYVSTVGIFGGDGSMGPFDEFSTPCPANKYGLTKWYGEILVRQLLTKHFILRAGWMMGGVARDKKFIMKIIRQLQEGKKEIFALEEVIGSPTYARDLIRTVSDLIRTEWWGTYQCTGNGKMSRYEVAQAIVDYFDPSVKVIPVQGDFFHLPAARALSEYGENRMLHARGLNRMLPVRDALKEYFDEIAASGFFVPKR